MLYTYIFMFALFLRDPLSREADEKAAKPFPLVRPEQLSPVAQK